MATVDKNFRVKNGLVVEGTTATVNGNDIVTTGSSTTNLPEGTNLYFTDERAQDAFGAMLGGGTQTNITVTYDDASGTVSFVAENGVGDSTTDDLSEGASNLYFTDERAQDAIGAMLGGTQTNITVAYDDASGTLSFVAENGVADSTTDDLTEGSTNLYFTDARALSATSSAYDAAGSAATAESNANANTDSLIGDGTVDGTAGNTVTDRISTAVSDLVGGAPALLDTLNELAAAIADDEAFSATVTTAIGEKVAKAGDTMTGFLTLHANPENNLHAANKQYVDNAVSTGVGDLDSDGVPEGDTNLYFTDERAQDAVAAAIAAGTHANITITYDDNANSISFEAENGVADSTTDDLTEGSSNLYFTDQRAVDALEAVVPNFTEVDINSVAKQIAATANLSDTNQTAAYSFAKADYRSAKLLVKAAYGVHTEISEILVTLDTSDNIAITEYAIVSTNGSLITVTAGINGVNVEILVTAGTANTDVTVVGTLVA